MVALSISAAEMFCLTAMLVLADQPQIVSERPAVIWTWAEKGETRHCLGAFWGRSDRSLKQSTKEGKMNQRADVPCIRVSRSPNRRQLGGVGDLQREREGVCMFKGGMVLHGKSSRRSECQGIEKGHMQDEQKGLVWCFW